MYISVSLCELVGGMDPFMCVHMCAWWTEQKAK